MNEYNISKVISGKIPIKIRLTQLGVFLKKIFLLLKKGKFKGLRNIEGFKEYDIKEECFDSKKKKNGISGIARLRNAEEFLEKAIESHLPFFDEIILADNMSEDNTRKICLSLEKKHPQKIKAVQYPFKTHKLGSIEYKNSKENSVYDLSYFYNRVLSQVTYKRVAKVDDDHILIPEIMEENRKRILGNKKYDTYYEMLGINIIKNSNEYYILSSIPFMGLYGDHGFFPISKKTYYVHDKKCENFVHGLKRETLPITFFHLKFLKRDLGTINYTNKIKKSVEDNISQKYIKLNEKMKNIFNKLFNK